MDRRAVQFVLVVGAWSLAWCVGSAASAPRMAVLHATVTITGGLQVTGVFDDPLPVATCAEVAAHGTMGRTGGGSSPLFYVPAPPSPSGNGGSVGGGHTFGTDVSATYTGPGTYSGHQLNATQMLVDAPPGSQDTHIFAQPTDIGTMIVKPDGSGSFQFRGWQDPGSVTISGQVTWTCAEQAPRPLAGR
jgi:hypothetical protein